MNIFRMSLVMMAVAVGSTYAAQKGEKKVEQRPGFGETIASVYPYMQAGQIIADKVCNEDEDFNKALIEALFVSLHKDQPRGKDFLESHMLNYSARKGTRYLNSKGVTLKAIGATCDIVPKNWATTRWVVNSTAKGVASTVTEPQFIAEVIKFGIASYAAKK